MPRLRRLVRAAGTYSVGSRTWNRRLIFSKEAPAQLFIDCLFQYRDEGYYLLHEFSAMPDHFHLLITPAVDVTLERAMQFIKGGSSHHIKKELRYTFPLWQKGFHDHRIRNATDYQQHRNYILLNAVREGLAGTPDEYPFCSAHPQYRNRVDSWPPQNLPSAAKAGGGGVNGTAALKRGPDRAKVNEKPGVEDQPLVGKK